MMMEALLNILKQNRGRFVSGEILAQNSGITRAGIWKQIEQLREIGYQIDSMPHRGYCLREITPVLHPFEVKENLKTRVFGQKSYYRQEVDSTNNWARIAAGQGEAEGAVFIADSQTKGKGRLGRGWASAPELGLWFSLIARPQISPSELAVITILTAVAAARAIKEVTGIQVRIKWPNDLVYNGRKLGGILAELNGEMDLVHFLILGVGLNVNQSAADFPPDLTEKAVSLKMIRGGGELSRKDLLQEFLYIFEQAYFSLSASATHQYIEYAGRYSATLGKRVIINQGSRIYQGKALALEADGSLKIQDDSGNITVIHSGEINGESYPDIDGGRIR
jgi:BirA family transcriptional regulator, biotin operon repressor / biotin---[acetyl-CoA-carboxylase] ligase